MTRGGSRPGAGRKPNDNYPRKYYTDAKTHATIRQIVESNKINQVQSANLSKCEGEALKNKK